MNFEKIQITLESFARQNGYEYNNKPLPYIPFGGVRGVFHNCLINMYIFSSESRIESSLNTVFSIPDKEIFPKGFCLEYVGNPNRFGKPFEEQISVLSYDESIVFEFLNEGLESVLLASFNEVDIIDTTIFKIRSKLRLSEDGIYLTVIKIFENLDDLNSTFYAVMGSLVNLKNSLASNQRLYSDAR